MKKLTYALVIVALAFSTTPSHAQSGDSGVSLAGVPSALAWKNAPDSWALRDGSLRIQAGRETDLFRDPRGEYRVHNAPMALFSPDEAFLLSSQVSVQFESDYDAGALVLYASDERWAKLAFELSPQKEPTLVSVVTNGVSDDVNHSVSASERVHLRVAGLGGGSYAFHYSTDGQLWRLLRYFSLGAGDPVRVGFEAQSPTGSSCQATFGRIGYKAEKLTDIRDGR